MLLNFVSSFTNLILFLTSFFPFHYSGNENSIDIEPNEKNELKFERTVIMIVDALRYDFVSKDYMPLTWKLLEEHGCMMNVEVESPTVTLPRIKSLTTGNVPLFTDVFYNLGNPQFVQDSLLHSARKQDKKIVFYGDETWLKMFQSEIFLRKEGTTSLFVTDFYEVDDNVTRNVHVELKRNDWDIMILHYLGLDHIGHVHGPFSPLIPLKLQEMDDIISEIFQKLSKSSHPLLILTGDHGMRDSGGHGGSTYQEKHVPLVILGTECENSYLRQVDFAPNLAVLLNLQIPSNSIGKLDQHFVKSLPMQQYLSALKYNSEILKSKHNLCNLKFEEASNLYQIFLKNNDIKDAMKAKEIYENCSFEISKKLIETSIVQFNIFSMLTSVIFIFVFLIMMLSTDKIFPNNTTKISFYIILLIARLLFSEIYLFPTAAIIALYGISKISLKIKFSFDSLPTFALFFQPLTWFSSSFIEEEHEYWYFILNSITLFYVFKQIYKKNLKSFSRWFLISILIRSSQTLNQTGDKWASLSDTSDFLKLPENYFFNFILITISVIGLCTILNRSSTSKCAFLDFTILTLIYVVKLDVFQYYNIYLVRIVYALILMNLVLNKNFLKSWTHIVCLVYKPHNLCLIPLTIYICFQISEENKKSRNICFHIILVKSLFFMQGNGNSLANVDVTVGYIGIETYNSVIVGFQIFVNIYSMSILVHLMLAENTNLDMNQVMKFLYIERLFCVVVFTVVSLVFRNHISIWTIYAPKLSIEFVHTAVFLVEMMFYNLVSLMKRFREKNCNDLKKYNV